jgi:hypothetical protein
MRDRGNRLARASDAVSAGLSSVQTHDLPAAARQLAEGQDLTASILAEDGAPAIRGEDPFLWGVFLVVGLG